MSRATRSQQHRALERLRIGEIVDSHFAAVSEHILERANLAKTVSRFFTPPPLTTPGALGHFGARALGLAPDIMTIGWLPEVDAARAGEVLQALQAAGVPNPTLRTADGQPIDPATLDRPMFPIVDIAPERNRFVIGVDAGSVPERLTAILEAKRTHEVTRTRPLKLVQSPDANALLLYAPIYDASDRFLGVMGFGFKVEEMFRAALAAAKAPFGTGISIYTHGLGEPLFSMTPETRSRARAPHVVRTEDGLRTGRTEIRLCGAARPAARGLSARSLDGGHRHRTDARHGAVLRIHRQSRRRAVGRSRVAEIGRGSAEGADPRAQSPGAQCHGGGTGGGASEFHARSQSHGDSERPAKAGCRRWRRRCRSSPQSDWKSVSLRSLVSDDILPFAGRIEMEGPDIALRARTAQTFALLFYELATNAAKHGALSVPDGRVKLEWRIDNLGSDPVFHLHWKESGGPLVAAPVRRGFGELLLRRIAPRDMAGKSEVRYDPQGFVYELQAPLRELIDTRTAVKTAA